MALPSIIMIWPNGSRTRTAFRRPCPALLDLSSLTNFELYACGICLKICALALHLFLEIHKVFLQKRSFAITHIFFVSALAAQLKICRLTSVSLRPLHPKSSEQFTPKCAKQFFRSGFSARRGIDRREYLTYLQGQ